MLFSPLPSRSVSSSQFVSHAPPILLAFACTYSLSLSLHATEYWDLLFHFFLFCFSVSSSSVFRLCGWWCGGGGGGDGDRKQGRPTRRNMILNLVRRKFMMFALLISTALAGIWIDTVGCHYFDHFGCERWFFIYSLPSTPRKFAVFFRSQILLWLSLIQKIDCVFIHLTRFMDAEVCLVSHLSRALYTHLASLSLSLFAFRFFLRANCVCSARQ